MLPILEAKILSIFVSCFVIVIDNEIISTCSGVRVRVMVFNVTFNNISVISWCSVLWIKETGKKHDLPQATDKLYRIMLYRVHIA